MGQGVLLLFWRFASLYNKLKCPNSILEWNTTNLRSCTILNFEGSENDLRFAKYVLKNAYLLQEMTIGFSTERMVLEKSAIIEELSSYPRISQGCKLSFEGAVTI
ncbi:putative FBD domain-containing protein [Medicago truncatula]|uniref:Putative FBD domain-containing protein n=1 Tax=Medicago truncatula TaxID=3880 RepID=A0A396HD10_MEDTR|nr:putative FBD domain-containing protein [Medicago truncatula]